MLPFSHPLCPVPELQASLTLLPGVPNVWHGPSAGYSDKAQRTTQCLAQINSTPPHHREVQVTPDMSDQARNTPLCLIHKTPSLYQEPPAFFKRFHADPTSCCVQTPQHLAPWSMKMVKTFFRLTWLKRMQIPGPPLLQAQLN